MSQEPAPPSSTQVPAPLLAGARRRQWAAAALVVALVVTGVVLVVTAGPRPLVPIPAYTLSIDADPAPLERPATPPLFHPGGRMTITARPAEPLRGKVDVVASIGFPDRAGGRQHALDAYGFMADDGTITISGKTEELFEGMSPGACQLTIHITRPGDRAYEPGGAVELTQALSWEGVSAR